jgi:hypothetical protein
MHCIAKLESLNISLSGDEYHFWNYVQGSGLTYTGERVMAVDTSKMGCMFCRFDMQATVDQTQHATIARVIVD